MKKALLPSPLLSASIFVMWLLLNEPVTPGTVLIALVVGLVAPKVTLELRPTPVRIRRPLSILRLMGKVTVDLLASNLHVARVVLFKRGENVESGFVHVPLEIRDPNALALLAMIVNATPGTAWAEVSFDRTQLLVHMVEASEEATVVSNIKNRYEHHLKEIFE
ncbi:MAG TPA: Na+/H+ antiporter subunit E [Myxococcaceae bacterium]|nr:Na+/H+ antiporter subunit E [Myxococcaceae bacterium]